MDASVTIFVTANDRPAGKMTGAAGDIPLLDLDKPLGASWRLQFAATEPYSARDYLRRLAAEATKLADLIDGRLELRDVQAANEQLISRLDDAGWLCPHCGRSTSRCDGDDLCGEAAAQLARHDDKIPQTEAVPIPPEVGS